MKLSDVSRTDLTNTDVQSTKLTLNLNPVTTPINLIYALIFSWKYTLYSYWPSVFAQYLGYFGSVILKAGH